MTPERWNEVCNAFTVLLDSKAEDRTNYLERSFGHDALLRDQVERLLRNAQKAESEGFLRGPAWIADDIPLFLPDFKSGTSEFSDIEYLGHGGMGVVYKAYQRSFDRWVALKLCSPHMTTPADVARFRAEAQSMARLRHPNIVTVHETGEYDGRPYFVMELIEGKSLIERIKDFPERPQEAALLVQTVAFAVHHAHQRQILHNDLKPANILLDEEGKPHVTDFGLAKRFGKDQVVSGTGAIEGTASYMSPEQAEGKEITTTSDVYGLGAILYALLTSVPPFQGETAFETLQLVRKEAPKPPRQLNPKVDSTLEAICLKCLKKDKAERYASANSLALDIGRYHDGKETLAKAWTRRDRLFGWCRRNRVEAGLAAAVITIWIFAGVMALSVAQARKAHLLDATLRSTTFAARDLATTALLQLRHLSRNVELATAGPKLAGLLEKADRNGLQTFIADICRDQPSPFKSCYIMNEKGIMVAHFPLGEHLMGADLGWRDHFQGAKKLGEQGRREGVHISRVYRGRSDNLYKFAISSPILASDGNFLGVIATSLTTDATLGPVILHDDSRQLALLARRDIEGPDRSTDSRMDRYVVLFHPAYQKGFEPVEFPNANQILARAIPENSQEFQLADSNLKIPPDDNFADPVSSVAGQYAGRWIAGFASVGNTGFVVVVQQRFEDAVSLETSTLWNLTLWSALASLVAVAILASVLVRWGRRQKLEAG